MILNRLVFWLSCLTKSSHVHFSFYYLCKCKNDSRKWYCHIDDRYQITLVQLLNIFVQTRVISHYFDLICTEMIDFMDCFNVVANLYSGQACNCGRNILYWWSHTNINLDSCSFFPVFVFIFFFRWYRVVLLLWFLIYFDCFFLKIISSFLHLAFALLFCFSPIILLVCTVCFLLILFKLTSTRLWVREMSFLHSTDIIYQECYVFLFYVSFYW